MDESSVREHAQGHGDATVAGDLRRAGSDLSKEALNQAGEVMGKMPKELTAAEVTSVERDGDEMLAQIRYSGNQGEVVVESRWAERDGRPKIIDLKVL